MTAPDSSTTQPLSAQLEASLLRALSYAWDSVNYNHFGEALQAPALALSNLSNTLGRWDPARRCIEIDRTFVLDQPWGKVIEVLKHEAAHQYVHEVLGVTGETSHGPAFRMVCQRAGIDSRATGVPLLLSDEESAKESKVLKRVAALLSLAQSANRHEAESATALAQRLMLKHNIALSQSPERQNYGYRFLGVPNGRVQEWDYLRAAILTRYFFVKGIWITGYRPRLGKQGRLLEVCGTLENLEMAGYVHSFLGTTAARLWRDHQKTHNIKGNRDRRSYYAGVMEGFRDRLRDENQQCQERGMVWVGDPNLKAYYGHRHPKVSNIRSAAKPRNAARLHGRAAGRNVVLNRGINSHSTGARRALPVGRGE